MARGKKRAAERPVGVPGTPPGEAGPPGEDGARPPFPIVAVGASAGGLEAFTQLVKGLTPDTGMAFVLVQHMDPAHTSHLTEILSRATDLPLRVAIHGMPVEPNHIYVMPAGTDMFLLDGQLSLAPRKDSPGQHRPIDGFMRSLAEHHGSSAIGVVLSGTASDGTLGLQEIKAAGGITFAQDSSAQHQGMPRNAIAAGSVDFVLPPDEMAREIARMGNHPYLAAIREAQELPLPGIRPIIDLLHSGMGVDFTHYKPSTLYRRITRRMVLHRMENLEEYARMLKSNAGEIEQLYQDVLISVTSFFRNPESFDALKAKVMPRLTHDRSRHDPIRIWVLGCSTGEEAYSVAMAFDEFAEGQGRQISYQIFATDLNGAGIEKARAGIYSKTITDDVRPDRLRRFFVEVDGSYRIAKSIRDQCVFARHNVLAEPPFSRMDLVTCRNLLIYLGQEIQQKVLQTLHYALKPGGVLWLGSSETIGSYRELFELEDAKSKLYVKRPAFAHAQLPGFGGGHRAASSTHHVDRSRGENNFQETQREADRILLAKYAPASVLVSSELEILQFRGNTGPYLAPAPGRATLNLFKMLREGLLVGVRAAVHRARKEETLIRADGLRVKNSEGWRHVNVEVIPVRGTNGQTGNLMVVFEPIGSTPAVQVELAAPEPPAPAPEDNQENQRLRQELAATREYLQSVIEQQEAANEELQTASEEVQSSNEELQSINEELETSKEEVQSSNEELATVNEELHNRNLELGQINNDLVNLLTSVQMPIVMLGPNLRIRRFTPTAEKMLNLIPSDVGRPLSDIQMNLAVSHLDKLVHEVMDTIIVKEMEVTDRQGRWYLLRIRPYRTLDNKIDGVVLVLVDVDTLKKHEVQLQRLNELLEQAYEPISMWEIGGKLTYWNRAAEEIYGYTREQAIGRSIHELLATSPSGAYLDEVIKREGRFTGDLIHTRRDGQKIVVETRIALVKDVLGRQLVVEATRPMTERKETERILRRRADDLVEADRHKDEFLAMLAHELRNPLAPLRNIVDVLRFPGTDGGTRTQALGIMERQIQNMARLIDDLLDVSRITLGRIQLRREPVRLDTLIKRSLEQIKPGIDAKQQELSVTLPAEPAGLNADMVRMDQILGNLLSNASKFTDRGGRIWLTAAVEPDVPATRTPLPDGSSREKQLVVRVRDTGIGIDRQSLPHIFDLFMRATRSVEHGGLGIGLTLVRRLVELHGGTVEARSEGPGLGSEFIVRLPVLAAVPMVVRDLPPSEAVDGPGRRILVVDDNIDAAETSAMLLRLDRHEVIVVHDGPSALRTIAQFHPEMVLLDIGMPGMDGFDVARAIRRSADQSEMVVIAVTGYGQEEARQRAAEAGFDELLTKPIDLSRLNEIIEALPARAKA